MSDKKNEEGTAPEGSSDSGNNTQDRSSLMKIIGKAIGLDITTIAIPVTYNEPTSFIQRMVEFLQYWTLLDKADRVVKTNPDLAILYVTAFAVSNFAPSERTTKPFNPLLGETFEYIDPSGAKCIVEQVSHHPPIGATHFENEHFIVEQCHHVKTKFLGNSLEINPTGKTLVKLKSTGTEYFFDGVWTTVHNLIIGRAWVDHYGDTVITERGSNRRVELKFKACSWFSKGWHEVEGTMYDDENTPQYHVAGLWNENLYATLISGKKGKSVSKMMKKHAAKEKKATKKAEKEMKKNQSKGDLNAAAAAQDDDDTDSDDDEPVFEEGKPVLLWQHTIKDTTLEPYKKWGLTDFTVELLKLTDEMKKKLPESDARLRTDRLALEKLDYDLAAKEKNILEEAQRDRRRRREARNLSYSPKYFTKSVLDWNGEEHWKFITENSYWDQREKGFGKNSVYDDLDRPAPGATAEKDEKKDKEEKEKKDKKKK